MANEGLTQVRNFWETTLTVDHTSSVTTLTVATTSGMPSAGIVVCGREVIYYTGTTGTTFTGCTRGFDSASGGGAATAHLKGARVRSVPTAAHHNDLVTAIAGAAGVNAGVAVGSTSAPTSTSNSFADVTNLSVTLTTTGGDLYCWTFMSIAVNTVPDNISLGIKLDSNAAVTVATSSGGAANYVHQVAGFTRFTGVSAGSHTVKTQWATQNSNTLTAQGTTQRQLIVIEI